MTKIVAVFNQKGGVGKTTTIVNLCACIADRGKRVCVIDIDPQGNTTSGYGINKSEQENTIYEVLIDEVNLDDAIMSTGYKNLFIVPSSARLAGAEIELVTISIREGKLKKALSAIEKNGFDYIFIDCPPSLGLLSINALVAADSVLIPIQCEYYALEGVSQLVQTIQLVKKSLNPKLAIQGVVLSMFDGRTNLSIQVVDEVKNYFKGKVYSTIIPRNIRLAEAPSFGKPVIYYDEKSKGSVAYYELAEEFIDLEEGEF